MQQFLTLGALWTLFNVATTISLPKYSSSQTYFAQSDPNIPVSQVDDTNNFGLKSQYSWDDVVSNLASNEKLFFCKDMVKDGIMWHQAIFLVLTGTVIGPSNQAVMELCGKTLS